MRVAGAALRDFRNYERASVELSDGLTVIVGPNGAGKTNLLEAVYFGCTAHSPRTSNERELVRSGANVTRVVLETEGDDGTSHTVEVGFQPGEAKRLKVDGSAVDSLLTAPERPLASVFLPERLELVKGAPASRRAHLDRFVAAVWPGRAETRAAYSRALAQRNALLSRVRAGASSRSSLPTWDAELAGHGVALMAHRREAVERLASGFAERAGELGLPERAELCYRPRSDAATVEELAAELAERHAADLDRGFTAHGPHRDELRLVHGGRALREYGSQGQQRVALLALLFAERDVIDEERGRPPLMLLDDVMSELDGSRRARLAELLGARGQAVLTATEIEHVPHDGAAGVLEVEGGRVAGLGVVGGS